MLPRPINSPPKRLTICASVQNFRLVKIAFRRRTATAHDTIKICMKVQF